MSKDSGLQYDLESKKNYKEGQLTTETVIIFLT